MNRWLQWINLLGVAIVAILCVVQWNQNRRLNLEINQLEKTRIEQTHSIEEQSKKIKGYTEDLETFRGDLTKAQIDLKHEREKVGEAEATVNRLTDERDQLKTSVTNWANAVSERDARLKENNERILKLNEDLNASVKKFNNLATNYNDVVKDLNELRAAQKNTNSAPAQ